MSKRSEKKRLTAEITSAKQELGSLQQSIWEAYARFNAITDPDMTDACIFEINSLMSRYDHVLKNLKTFY